MGDRPRAIGGHELLHTAVELLGLLLGERDVRVRKRALQVELGCVCHHLAHGAFAEDAFQGACVERRACAAAQVGEPGKRARVKAERLGHGRLIDAEHRGHVERRALLVLQLFEGLSREDVDVGVCELLLDDVGVCRHVDELGRKRGQVGDAFAQGGRGRGLGGLYHADDLQVDCLVVELLFHVRVVVRHVGPGARLAVLLVQVALRHDLEVHVEGVAVREVSVHLGHCDVLAVQERPASSASCPRRS